MRELLETSIHKEILEILFHKYNIGELETPSILSKKRIRDKKIITKCKHFDKIHYAKVNFHNIGYVL
jgi:hypothetical protein